MTKCPICHGAGKIQVTEYRKKVYESSCPVCLGKGWIMMWGHGKSPTLSRE